MPPPAPGEPVPFWHRIVYVLSRWGAFVLLLAFYRLRSYFASRVPISGPLLFAANHQSYLDPPIVGITAPTRPVHFIAKSELFASPAFASLMTALNSVPIRESANDAAAIKEVLRRLGRGEAVVIFPEGSRTLTGSMDTFKRGVALLVKRARCPVVPVAVEGAYDAWPAGSRPRLGGRRVAVMYGNPIPHAELMRDGPDAALIRLAREIEAMRLELRAKLREETGGRFPAPGAGDRPAPWLGTDPGPRAGQRRRAQGESARPG